MSGPPGYSVSSFFHCILYVPTNAAARHSCRWLWCRWTSATQISFKPCAEAIGWLSLHLWPTNTEAITPWGCFPSKVKRGIRNYCRAMAPGYPTSLAKFFSPAWSLEPLLPNTPFSTFSFMGVRQALVSRVSLSSSALSLVSFNKSLIDLFPSYCYHLLEDLNLHTAPQKILCFSTLPLLFL